MKKHLKTVLLLVLVLSLISPIAVFATDEIKVSIDGKYVDFDVKPQLINDRTMVPLRAVFEALGAKVNWNNDTETVFAIKDNTMVTTSIGSTKIYINNTEREMDIAPILMGDRTLVPIRFIAESFGYNVEWDENTSTVLISAYGSFNSNNISSVIRDDGKRYYYFKFESGVIATTGYESARDDRIRTIDYIPIRSFKFDIDTGYEYNILYFDTNKKIITSTGFMTEPYEALSDQNIAYIRIVLRASDKSNIAKELDSAYQKLITTETNPTNTPITPVKDNQTDDKADEYISIEPESEGVKNAIKNFKQLTNISYETLTTIPHTMNGGGAGFEKAKEYTGLPYSSTRPEALFVPNNVSFHTFLSAVQNPNSYLYKVNLGEQGNQNGNTYYGTVCSTACAYALNITPMYSTHQWTKIPGMKVIDVKTGYDLKLCDTIVGRGHVIMVTDITKNKSGEIGHITITEAKNPRCVSTNYTLQEINEEIEQYKGVASVCRYDKINEVIYTPSTYIPLDNEESSTISFNTDIIPRKGDKANWLYGTDVEIDVLNKNSYTMVEIYKNESLYKTQKISDQIILKNLEHGDYKARLKGNNTYSDWCYFKVVDAESFATTTQNSGEINVKFSSKNAIPLYIQWTSTSNGTVNISSLNEDEIKKGEATCSYIPGKYKIRVAFKTDYGIIFSKLPDAITVN